MRFYYAGKDSEVKDIVEDTLRVVGAELESAEKAAIEEKDKMIEYIAGGLTKILFV